MKLKTENVKPAAVESSDRSESVLLLHRLLNFQALQQNQFGDVVAE